MATRRNGSYVSARNNDGPAAPRSNDRSGRVPGADGPWVQHPVPVEISYWAAGRFETVLAVNYAAAQELIQKINAEKGTERHACIGKVGEPLRTANS
jgi:hypothetical protein